MSLNLDSNEIVAHIQTLHNLGIISPTAGTKKVKKQIKSPRRSYLSSIGDKIMSKNTKNNVPPIDIKQKNPIPKQMTCDNIKHSFATISKNLNPKKEETEKTLESEPPLQSIKKKITIKNNTSHSKEPEEKKEGINNIIKRKTSRVEIPLCNIKLYNSQNQALKEFLLNIAPSNKQFNVIQLDSHSKKEVLDPHFLKNYFDNLINESNFQMKQTIIFPQKDENSTNNDKRFYFPGIQTVVLRNSKKTIHSSLLQQNTEDSQTGKETDLSEKRKNIAKEPLNINGLYLKKASQNPNYLMEEEIDAETKKAVLKQLVCSLLATNEEKENLIDRVGELINISKTSDGTFLLKPKEKQNNIPIDSFKKQPKHRQLKSLQEIQTPKEKNQIYSEIEIPLQIKEIRLENKEKKKVIFVSKEKKKISPIKDQPTSSTNIKPTKKSSKVQIQVNIPQNEYLSVTPRHSGQNEPFEIKQFHEDQKVVFQPSPQNNDNEKSDKKFASPPKRIIIKSLSQQLEELKLESFTTIYSSLRTYVSTKPESSIKKYHTDYCHLQNHPINKELHYINQFISSTFKSKDANLNKKTVLVLCKYFGLQIPWTKGSFEPQLFKSKETAHPLKEKILKHLWNIINSENEIPNIETVVKQPQYKFYVSDGNNGMLVKSILKERWWWSYGNKKDESINLCWTQWCKKSFIQTLSMKNFQAKCAENQQKKDLLKVCNHLENHFHLSNKKAMFINMQQFYMAMKKDPFETLPFTFHIKFGTQDPEFERFTNYYNTLEAKHKQFLLEMKEKPKGDDDPAPKKKISKNIWIIKPGENSNRGHGIQVLRDYDEIKKIVSVPSTTQRTYIVQKYIENPLLINRRKFDIRMYGMLTSINGLIKGYFYEEGYIRTSSKEFTLKNLANKTIHLTNDAVQNKTEDYGKYETRE